MVRKKNKMFVDSADRTPHYSLRKLSVGVASVLLSTTLWMGANGSVAHADTINDATVAGKVEDKLDPSETHKDQTQAQTAESTSQASVASAEKQNGEAQKGQAQVAVANANQAVKKQAQGVDSANAEAQTATANDAQADVAKQEPAAQSKQPAPKAQASTAEQAAGQASAAATEGQTNGSANADAANNATKKDSANPEANSSDAVTEDAKNESTTLDVNQAFKMPINKKMVMASLASAAKPTNTADSISELEKANEDTTAVPGFSVTDPEYPSEMYRDPDSEHYSFFWADGLTDNGYRYQTVISTNRTGDGQIHVFELDQSNNFLDKFDVDINKSHKSGLTGATYYNDEYAGLISAGSQGELTLKYEVSGGETDQPYNKLSFIVPRLNTQVTSYHDEDGNDIIDKNGNKIEPVKQQGLDGQKYTTADTKVIKGYYAIAPSNAQGTMSPYGKIGSKYEKNWHDGYSAVFTQTDNDGTMSVKMYYEGYRVKQPPIIIKPGDHDIYSGVGNIYLRSIYVPQTTDIRYVYKELGKTFFVDEDGNPFMGEKPTQYPNSNDPTKAGKVVIPQYKGYTPKINGVPVGPDGFIPTHPGEDTVVVYTANLAKALVRFIDNTENRTLDNLELSGKTGETIDFAKANAQLKSYLDRGYNLVANGNGIPTTETKFDTIHDSDDTDDPSQVFVVRLDHGTVTVTPENPVDPGSKINPKDPDSPTYTSDQAAVTEDHYLTVHYVGAPKNPADNRQNSHWTREVTIDKVTGKTIHSTDWVTTDSYVKVETPEIAGYTPDTSVVDKPTVRTNQDVTVTYTASAAKALVRFIDNTENRTLDNLELSGKTGETIDFAKANAQLKSYLDRGYNLVANGNGIPTTETKFDTIHDSDDTDDPSQVFVVRLDHGTVTVTPENPVDPGSKINPKDPDSPTYTSDQAAVTEDHYLTVHYVGAPKNPADNRQNSHWTREVTIDKVTGKTIHSTDWVTTDSYVKVETPEIAGYTPDTSVVDKPTVRTNQDVTVTYTANAAKALVRFIDNTENRTLDNLELSGKTGETIDFAKANAQLKSYLDRGYNLVANGNGIPTTETKFDTIHDSDDTDDPSQVFVVRLDHGTVTVTPENPVDPGSKINPKDPDSPTYTSDQAAVTEDHYLTVHYVGAPKNPADNRQNSHWTREVTIDKVTGKTIHSTDWVTTDSYVKVETPEIAGYTPDTSVVDKPTVRTNQDVTVTYTANAAKALVRFIDNTENRTLDNLELSGKTGETIDFAKANAQLKSYLDRGYNLVANGNGIPTTETKFDTIHDSDDTDDPSQVFVVRLDHGTVTVTPENPVDPGSKINPKDPDSPTYTSDQAAVTEDHYLTVHYVGAPKNPADNRQNSHWTREVTIDKVTGKTIHSTDWVTTDSYVKVETPEIAGYTPDTSVVDKPTVRTNQDVTVTYTANAAKALVRFIDNTENRTLDNLELSGKTGETIDFAKANAQLKSYLDRGYNLVANGNGIPTTETKFDTIHDSDDTDDPSQVFVVRLDHGTVTVTPENPVDPGSKINPKDPDSPTYTSDQAAVTEDHYLTVHYVGAPKNPADNRQNSHWTREVTIDKVTGKTIHSTDWVTTDSYVKVETPEIAGYTPDTSVVDKPTVRTNQDVTVTYTANAAKALVRFIDNTENRTLDNLELSGKTGETIDFAKANAQLKSYLDRGYNLVANGNGIPTTETKFDTIHDSDDTDDPSQVFVVRLDHGTVTVTPENPVDPGSKINPKDPDSPTYTSDQAAVTEDHYLTVHYVGAPKNPADNRQNSHWTREVTIDKVTGKTIHSTDWVTTDSYVKVETPEIAGYTPDTSVVDKPTVRTNQDVTVTYTANAAKALVRFIDNTENRTLDNLELSGKTGETIDFAKANAQLKSYLDRGYNLVANGNGIPTTETKFDTIHDSDDTDDPSQVFVVRLDHGTVTVTPENPVDPGSKINPKDPDSPTYTSDQAAVTEDHYLTVHYVGAPKNPADNRQNSHWTREVTIDKVTGKTIHSTDWVTTDSYVKVETPEIAGYTPDTSVVDKPTVRTNQDVTVTYTANAAKALVRFIDNTENRTLDNLELSGKTGETIDFAKANAQLKSYLDRGYNLVANGNGIPTTETKFDTIHDSDDTDDPSQVFVVRLDHGTVTVTPENPVDPGSKINPKDPDSPTYTSDQAAVTEDHYLTVHYVGAPKNPADNRQNSHWTREVTIDKVTGKTIHSTDWVTTDSYVKVETPEIAGYTPDTSVVDKPTVRTNQDVTVTYTANAAKALVRFIDNTENRTLDNLELSGKTGETIDFAKANAQLKSYLDRGYNLVANGNGIPTTETKFDTIHDSDDTDDPSQVFVVRLDHGTVTVTPENPVDPGSKINPKDPDSPTYTSDQAAVTEDHYLTVHYVGAPKNPADNRQNSHWTREVTIDKVTGKTIHSTDWVTTDSYVKVETPEIAGYTPDTSVVDKPTVRTNQDVTVTYTANAAKALVRFIDNTENRTLDNLELSGKTGETIDFAKANAQLKSYLDRGYNLVANGNGIPTTETKFDTIHDSDGPSQVFEVHLDHTMTPGETTVPGKQTVTYVYKDKDGKVVKTKTVEEGTIFTGKTTKDEVTGKTTTTWDQKDHKYTEVTTPVEPGYTADKKSVGGDTVTPDDPNRSYEVVYTPNGSIVPVDPKGNPIPGTKPVPYETNPTDPTKVVAGKVPEVPNWTPKNGKPGDPVVLTDPSKDTKVPYDHTKTTSDTTATGKVEGLPEKPAKSAKAPAEKLVKTPVKAPKAVKTAEPAKTISIKESAQAQDQLPQTGEDNSKAAFGLGLASILGGIGILGAFKRKKKEN